MQRRNDDKKLTRILQTRLDEFQKLQRQGALFSAATRLGQISFALPALSSNARNEWSKILEGSLALLDDEDSAVLQGIENGAARVVKISAHGGKLLFEEICLVISERLDVKCALEFLRLKRRLLESDALERIDVSISELGEDENSRSEFVRASQHVSRNYGLPIKISELLPIAWVQ